MALTGMAVYKSLPKDHANCGDCGFPTCMAFAMQVAAKQKAISECPHLSDDAKGEMADATAPPMKLVHIGPAGDTGVEIGRETVMFRHEEKFHKAPALAARIPASLSAEAALAKLEQVNQAVFTRVGDELSVRLAAVDTAGLSSQQAEERVKTLAPKSRVPLIVMGTDPEAMAGAVAAIADQKPLIYQATPENADAFIALAAANKCPLAISAASLEQLADMATAARNKGVDDLVLSFDGRTPGRTIRDITMARRAALRKRVRALGYPSMVDVCHDNPTKETVLAATFAAKYAAIIIMDGVDASELLPVLTTIQNVYTDPQVPNTVEAKLYEIGSVDENSPVMFTTNFSLTYFCVEGEVERSKVPSYICVVETEGLGVLNAFAGDKLSAERVVKALEEQGVADKVKHRKLIIPGLLPAFRAEIEDTSVWEEVIIGPENASGIPSFLSENWN